LPALNATNLQLAAEIARVPEHIKGFGHVKERNVAAARSRRDTLLAQWNLPAGAASLARAA
jgi:indolepyruvate ferredoxin oxidoreductase